MPYAVVSRDDEEAAAGTSDGGCDMIASTGDKIFGAGLVVATLLTMLLMVARDLGAATPPPCDVLQIAKHLHCVQGTGERPLVGEIVANATHANRNTAAEVLKALVKQKPRTFSEVLDAQGAEREHYSVVEKERLAARAQPHSHQSPTKQQQHEHDHEKPPRLAGEQHEDLYEDGVEWLDPTVAGR